MIPSRLLLASTLIGMSAFVSVASARIVSSSSASSEPRACTMEAQLCPDGETYVGRTGPNCEFAACPGASSSSVQACTKEAKVCPDGSTVGRTGPNCAFAACPDSSSSSSAHSCEPYRCVDGTEIASCGPDGHVIYYFAPPCMTHGGDAGPFGDVSANDPNANAIAYLKAEGIAKGYADGTFRPDSVINRAEFTKILIEATQGADDGRMCKIAPFADIAFGSWYESYAQRARCLGIVQGYPDGTFRAAAAVNFVEAAKIIVNAFGIATDAGHTAPAETWYEPFVTDLSVYNAIPLSIRSFDQKITRGEMAEIIWRVHTNTIDQPWETRTHWIDFPSKTYEELAGKAMTGDGCQIGGCSGEVCGEESDDPIVSNCIYRPEFACYKSGVCEMQPNGGCGWRQTPELAQCLENAR